MSGVPFITVHIAHASTNTTQSFESRPNAFSFLFFSFLLLLKVQLSQNEDGHNSLSQLRHGGRQKASQRSFLKHTEQNVFAAYVCAFRHHYHKGSRKADGSNPTVPSGTHSEVLMMLGLILPSPRISIWKHGGPKLRWRHGDLHPGRLQGLSLIHISEPTRQP